MKRSRSRTARKGQRTKKMCHASESIGAFMAALPCGGTDRTHLSQLWRNWAMVMGEELALLAVPLGHREGLLLIGAEDNMALSELNFSVPEILERANAFMNEPYFTRVEFHLSAGHLALDIPQEITPSQRVREPLAKPPGLLGKAQLDPKGMVGRCYAAYLKRFLHET